MKLYFEEATLWEARKQRVFDEINQLGFPLVLFGRSKRSDSSFLKKMQVPVQYVCSNNPASWGTKFWGLEVISPSKLEELYKNYTVLILAQDDKDEFSHQFQQLPVPPVRIFRLDLHWQVHSPMESAVYFQERKEELEKVYNCLADQKSKDVYEAAIQYRMTRDLDSLKPFVSPLEEQYFPAFLGGEKFLGSHEVFVDAGAYIGDTVQNFLSAIGGKNGEKCPGGGYKHIYAIEPESKNYQELKRNLQNLENITYLKYGLGDTARKIYITQNGFMSHAIENDDGECIQEEALDHLIADVPVTYIKMDIEGMECPALRGAKKLIQKYHPKLAICIYHSDSDMIKVPQQILNLDSSYRLYIRHYTHGFSETVCYAI